MGAVRGHVRPLSPLPAVSGDCQSSPSEILAVVHFLWCTLRQAGIMTKTEAERAIVDAVLYAMRSGCFFPVPEPKPPYTTQKLVRWGAMRHLHDVIATFYRESERD